MKAAVRPLREGSIALDRVRHKGYGHDTKDEPCGVQRRDELAKNEKSDNIYRQQLDEAGKAQGNAHSQVSNQAKHDKVAGGIKSEGQYEQTPIVIR